MDHSTDSRTICTSTAVSNFWQVCFGACLPAEHRLKTQIIPAIYELFTCLSILIISEALTQVDLSSVFLSADITLASLLKLLS